MNRLLVSLALLIATGGAPACPMCKDSVPNREGAAALRDSYNSNGQNISGGINASVYFMLGGLVGVIGLVGTVIVKGARSAEARRGFPKPGQSGGSASAAPDPTSREV